MNVVMKWIRPKDLSAVFQPDGRLLVRSISTGIGALLPSWVASILAFCSEAKSPNEIAETLGPRALQVLDQLVEIGLLLDPASEQNEVMFSNFASVPVHRKMLMDEVRLSSYKRAIEATVRPGDVVIDAGSGTGVLAVYAALAGAKHVYAIEQSDFADWIPVIAKQNGVLEKVTLVRGNFGTVNLPEKADVLITETFGAWALAEGAATELAQCIDTNLKDNARLIPSHIQFHITPLQKCPKILLHPFRLREDGLDLSPMQNEAYLRSENMLIKPTLPSKMVARLALRENNFSTGITLEQDIEALGLHFTLELTPDIFLPTGPKDPPTHWKQTVIASTLSAGEHTIAAHPSSEDRRTLLLELDNHSYRVR
jgi:hypothetical protein